MDSTPTGIGLFSFIGKQDRSYANSQGCQDGYSALFFGAERTFLGMTVSPDEGHGSALHFTGDPGISGPWRINSISLGRIALLAAQAQHFSLAEVRQVSISFKFDPTKIPTPDSCSGDEADVANISNFNITCSGTNQDNASCIEGSGNPETQDLQIQ